MKSLGKRLKLSESSHFLFLPTILEHQLANKDDKSMKSIVLSSVSEFSITDVPSKDTRSDRKLSDSTTSSLSSLQKCETQFNYLEDAASGHERDNNGTFLLMKQIFTNLLYKSSLVILGCVHPKGNGGFGDGFDISFCGG